MTYRTFRRWMAEPDKPRARRMARPGRPRTPEEIRELVTRIARETGWGYARILSELKKLRVHSVSKTTIRKILKDAGFDPGPQRGAASSDEFLRTHAQSLWACDFISKKVWTLNGLVDYYVLFFIHLGSRQVVAYPATAHPNGAWVAQQARNFVFDAEEQGLPIGYVIHDWDAKFAEHFDAVLESGGATIHRLGPAKPNLNAYAERFAQTLKHECLDHFVVLGRQHLNHLVHEFVEHYNHERPHMVLGHTPRQRGDPSPDEGRICCPTRLGALLRHYHRVAA